MTDVTYSLDWPYAWGGPVGQCLFKSRPEDFIVEELLPFEPEGQGEHVYLNVEKEGENTDWVAGQLAKFAGVKRSSVSYAGRKDRQGITRQWFSVWMPGMEEPDWAGVETETLRLLATSRHGRKLKTGALKGNRFRITLRDVEADQQVLERVLGIIAEQGVPNYFGEQRFGQEGRNLERAVAMFSGEFRAHRNKKSMYLSAARSFLFNRVVGARVEQDNWLTYLGGDVPGFQDSGSLILRNHDSELLVRIQKGEVALTAPLWGKGELKSSGECQSLELAAGEPWSVLREGLEAAGLKQERRAIRLIPMQLDWRWLDEKQLELVFSLPKGCFATAVLRELLNCEEPGRLESPVA